MLNGRMVSIARYGRRTRAAMISLRGLWLTTILVTWLTLPLAAAPGDWASFVDGTVYHVSPGAGDAPDLVKHDPLVPQGDDLIWAGSSGGLTGFQLSDSTYVRLHRNDGLPSEDVTAVGMDADGNLWIGTRAHGLTVRSPDGLFLKRPLDRFDLGSDSLRVVLSMGAELWVGTASGAARVQYPPDPDVPGEGSVLERVNLASFLGQSPYVNTIAARDDTTWFGTERGVVRLDPLERRQENAGLDAIGSQRIQALLFHDGDLWAATAAGPYRFEDGAWVARGDGYDPTREPRSLAVFDGELYMGVFAGDSVYRLDAAGPSWSPLQIETGRVVAGMAGQGERLWAATNRGLYVLGTDESWSRLPSVDPPSPGFVNSDFDYVDVAAEPGGVWALTRRFITHYAGGAWEGRLRGTGGVESTSLARVTVDGQGRVMAGHCCCGTLTTCRADFLEMGLSEDAIGLPAYDILATTADPAGYIWLGSVRTDVTNGEGFYRYDPDSGELIRYTPTGVGGSVALPGMSSTSVTALAVDGRGRLWIGHQSEGVDVWAEPGNTGSRIDHIDQFDGLPSDRVVAIATAGDGAWVGTTSGLGQVGGDLFVVRTVTGDVLPAPEVTDVAVDGCGRVWATTLDGVARLSGDGALQAIFDDSTIPGPVDERVTAVSVDRDGAAVWFSTRLGLSRFEYDASCSGASGGGGDGPCDRLCPYPNPLRVDQQQNEVFLTDAPAMAEIQVVDALGREIWVGTAAAGAAAWNGRDRDGNPVPSGVYLLSITSEGETHLRHLAVIR